MAKLQRSKLTAALNKAAQLTKTHKPKAVGFSVSCMLKKRTLNNKSAAVYMALNYGKERIVFSTRIEATKSALDPKTGRITGNPNGTKLLGDLLQKANACHADLVLTNRRIDLNFIRAFVLGIEIQNTPTASECIRMFEAETTKNYEAGNTTKETLDKLIGWNTKIVEFISTEHRKGMALSDIVPAYAQSYCLWLQTKKMIGNDSAMKMTGHFKRVLDYAVENEWIERNPFLRFKKKLINKRGDYLTALEISQLSTTPIQSSVLDRVRDFFVMQCYTGMAYAEIKALAPSHIKTAKDGTKYIAIQRKKTIKSNIEKCIVPLTKAALLLIEKYQTANSETCFEVQANQKVNNYLKEIAVITGIKKRLTTHVARRSFAEYCLNEQEMRPEVVAKILGHTSSKTTMKHYASIRPETVIREASKLLNQNSL